MERVCEAVNRNVQSPPTHIDLLYNSNEAVHFGNEHTSEAKEEKSSAVPMISSSGSNPRIVTNLIQAVSSSGTEGVYASSASYQQVRR